MQVNVAAQWPQVEIHSDEVARVKKYGRKTWVRSWVS